ncbi:hypothetical protein ACWCQ0_12100 [Streptomyces massasporeus]|uniref:Uncharacterized protein n=1 Tax=Streptomyces massasporeus TaxID=67324 RepID=A0ABW6LMH7_9ACTN
MSGLREVGAPFVVPGPCGVAVRDRLKDLTAGDEQVPRLVGDHPGTPASLDLKARCAAGPGHVAGCGEPRPGIPGPRTRSVRAGYGANAGNQDARHRPGRPAEHESWHQDSLPLSL